MKYRFNITPIEIEADSEEEAWSEYENGYYIYECDNMEEVE